MLQIDKYMQESTEMLLEMLLKSFMYVLDSTGMFQCDVLRIAID